MRNVDCKTAGIGKVSFLQMFQREDVFQESSSIVSKPIAINNVGGRLIEYQGCVDIGDTVNYGNYCTYILFEIKIFRFHQSSHFSLQEVVFSKFIPHSKLGRLYSSKYLHRIEVLSAYPLQNKIIKI